MKKLFLIGALILAGCSKPVDNRLIEYNSMKTAWLNGASCGICYGYEKMGYPNEATRKLCERFKDCANVNGFNVFYAEYREEIYGERK